ncbi:sensor histidine kinase [Enterococcus sp. AZ103]|uniref:sensor histidine kinase n=1 Tax=Enterococcus sp. AZ103 TaxID=2774628 RepID=UPI003F24A1B4
MNKFRLFPAGETISSLIWLLFLLIPMMSLFPYDTFLKQIAGLSLLLFAWFYRNTLFDGKYFIYWIVLQYLIALFYVLTLGFIQLFMFPAWKLGFSKIRNRTFWQLFILQIILMTIGLIFGPVRYPVLGGGDQLVMTIGFSLFTLVAPLAGQEFYHQQEQRKQYYQANKRMEGVIKGEERNRIARELHDSLGQSLSVMTIKLDLAQKILYKKPALVENELKEIETISRSTLKTVREIVSDMRQRTVAEELIDVNQALTAAKIILTTENEELAAELAPPQQTEFSSILREAVTNIVRHSKASYCTIAFQKAQNYLQVSIKDNGIGTKDIITGNGLTGMKERIEKINGSFVIQEDKGTLLRFNIPLKEVEND